MVPGEATIIPLYIICNRLHLLDSYVGIMAPTIAVSMNMIILTNFFKGIPDELIEAAIIDGAGHGKIFARLILPLIKPVLVTVPYLPLWPAGIIICGHSCAPWMKIFSRFRWGYQLLSGNTPSIMWCL